MTAPGHGTARHNGTVTATAATARHGWTARKRDARNRAWSRPRMTPPEIAAKYV